MAFDHKPTITLKKIFEAPPLVSYKKGRFLHDDKGYMNTSEGVAQACHSRFKQYIYFLQRFFQRKHCKDRKVMFKDLQSTLFTLYAPM